MANPTKYEWNLDGNFIYALMPDPEKPWDETPCQNWFMANVQPCGRDTATDDERRAIAKLMCAAPKLAKDKERLLASLKEMCADFGATNINAEDYEHYQRAMEAIRAAEGAE